MADSTVKAVPLYDTVGYREDGQTKYADKADGEFELPSDEFDRLAALDPPAVAKAGTKAAKEAAAEEPAPGSEPTP